MSGGWQAQRLGNVVDLYRCRELREHPEYSAQLMRKQGITSRAVYVQRTRYETWREGNGALRYVAPWAEGLNAAGKKVHPRPDGGTAEIIQFAALVETTKVQRAEADHG